MAYLAGITIFPVKSLDGVAVEEAKVLESGAIEFDRRFALLDARGSFVNGKREPKVHSIRSTFDWPARSLRLRARGDDRAFHVDRDRADLEAWLSDYFGYPVSWRENDAAGFPDDIDAPGPTVVSAGTLDEVASWFPGLSRDDARARFRANLEISGVPAFWEDRLFTAKPRVVRFRIGDVAIDGVNPCQRCVVPPRDPKTGEALSDFARTFMDRRRAALPPWADRSRFNHYYRLAVNTVVPPSEAGKALRVGDEVEIVGPRE